MVAFQENIICGRFFIKFPTKFLKNNMGEVKIEFQENNNGLRFFCADRRSLWEYFSMSVAFK